MNVLNICLAIILTGTFVFQKDNADKKDISITGYVYVHRLGSVLSDAEIVLKSVSSHEQYKAYTDKTGKYDISNIPFGRYFIRVSCIGFVDYQKELQLGIDQHLVIDIGLKVGSLDGTAQVEDKIYGSIKQEDGSVLPNAKIVVISVFDEEVIATVRANDEGKFTTSIKGNQFIVYAYKPGFEVRVERLVLTDVWPRSPHNINFILTKLKE